MFLEYTMLIILTLYTAGVLSLMVVWFVPCLKMSVIGTRKQWGQSMFKYTVYPWRWPYLLYKYLRSPALQRVQITPKILEFSKSIINENHDILNPKLYLKHRVEDPEFESQLKKVIGSDNIDYVLFSSRSGAEEHVDTHLKHLDIHTFIIPILLPSDPAILHTSDGDFELEIGVPIKLNHQLPHSLEVQTDEPLVVVMASRVL